MPKCPNSYCEKGSVRRDDGDGGYYYSTCGTCYGTGEVSDAYIAEVEAAERRRRDEELVLQSRIAHRKGEVRCAYAGELKLRQGFFAWPVLWYKCRACGATLCEKHVAIVAKRAPLLSFATFLCPYCSGRDSKMDTMD